MSSATTAAAAAAADDAVTVVDTAEKPQRRFPPPCWTQEETLALIEAYRERWYALRRGYLRTADWDSVATTVAGRCPSASPAKTSAQCRHKMEKLRQRFRAEKQRAASFPNPGGRYFSSWFFFENMEAMENGTTPPATVLKPENSADETRVKSFLDQNIVKLKLKSKIPPRPTSGGYKCGEWLQSDKIWSGRLHVVSCDSRCEIRLEDPNSAKPPCTPPCRLVSAESNSKISRFRAPSRPTFRRTTAISQTATLRLLGRRAPPLGSADRRHRPPLRRPYQGRSLRQIAAADKDRGTKFTAEDIMQTIN